MNNKYKQQAQKENLKRLVTFIRETPQITFKSCIAAGFSQSFLATFYLTGLRRARLQERQAAKEF